MKLNFFLSAALFSSSVLGLTEEPETAPAPSNLEVLKNKVSELYYDNDVYNHEAIDARLQECPVVIDLNNYIREESLLKEESFIEKLFTRLFPFGPAGNSILATSYISGPPNFLLALIPPNINPASLNTLVSFAIGGLLGDVFLHLLPQTFVGEVHDEGARFLIVDEKRNTILGLAMFVGFLAFIILDKGMRIMGAGHDHSQDKITVTHKQHVEVHGHVEEEQVEPKGKSSSVEKKQATKRNTDKDKVETDIVDSYEISKEESGPSSSIKLSAYLNLIADFTHNITDGLAISASFYISKSVGATTCLAVFFHEVF
jgi:zinc transporter 7